MSPHKKRMPVISLTIFFLILLSTGLSGYYVWQGFIHGFDKYLPILCSTLLLDGLGVFALVFKVSFETRRRAVVPFVASLSLLIVCSIHLAALANMRVGAISQDEQDTRATAQDDYRHKRNVQDAERLVETNCPNCSPERKRRMYQSEMSRLEKSAPVDISAGKSAEISTGNDRSWGRRYVEDFATAVQLIFGLLCGLAMLVNNFLRMYADDREVEEEFPNELEVKNRLPAKRQNFTTQKDTAKTLVSFNSEGLKHLREALKDISFRLHKRSFKADVKDDAVWVRMMAARDGTQETIASAKAKLSILDDAARMERTAFRERLERFLIENGFEI